MAAEAKSVITIEYWEIPSRFRTSIGTIHVTRINGVATTVEVEYFYPKPGQQEKATYSFDEYMNLSETGPKGVFYLPIKKVES